MKQHISLSLLTLLILGGCSQHRQQISSEKLFKRSKHQIIGASTTGAVFLGTAAAGAHMLASGFAAHHMAGIAGIIAGSIILPISLLLLPIPIVLAVKARKNKKRALALAAQEQKDAYTQSLIMTPTHA